MSKRLWMLCLLGLHPLLSGAPTPTAEPDAFWERPLPAPAVAMPDGLWSAAPHAAGQTFLLTLAEPKRSRQWRLQVSPSDATPKSQANPFTIYANNGDVLAFSSAMQVLELRCEGPVLIRPGKMPKRENKVEIAQVDVPRDYLALGFDEACVFSLKVKEIGDQLPQLHFQDKPFPEGSTEAVREQFAGLGVETKQLRAVLGMVPALMAYVELISKTPGIADIFMEIMNRPSVWSVVRHGLNLSIDASGQGVAEAVPAEWGLPADVPCYRFPIRIAANGTPALNALLYVTRPEGPYQTTAGVVGIVAWSPDDPARVLTVRLAR